MGTVKTRSPRFFPRWLRERVEVNTYKLTRFMRQAATEIPQGAHLLDAGAGEGRFRADFNHTQYVGVDLAVGDTEWDYSQLDTIADLSTLPFTEGIFDAAVCAQVLEHVQEPAVILAEIARVLKPGGRLYLSAPQSWHQHQKPHDYFRYTSYGLAHLLIACGYQVKSIDNLGGYFWFLSFQLQNMNYWIFSHRRKHWITWPIRAVLSLFFQLIFPLFLFYLDGLDPVKDETFGHVCVAIKPELPPR